RVIVDSHGMALPGQAHGNRAANAARSPGDDSDRLSHDTHGSTIRILTRTLGKGNERRFRVAVAKKRPRGPRLVGRGPRALVPYAPERHKSAPAHSIKASPGSTHKSN